MRKAMKRGLRGYPEDLYLNRLLAMLTIGGEPGDDDDDDDGDGDEPKGPPTNK